MFVTSYSPKVSHITSQNIEVNLLNNRQVWYHRRWLISEIASRKRATASQAEAEKEILAMAKEELGYHLVSRPGQEIQLWQNIMRFYGSHVCCLECETTVNTGSSAIFAEWDWHNVWCVFMVETASWMRVRTVKCFCSFCGQCVCVCGCVRTLVPVQVFGKRLDGKKVFYVGVVPLSEIIFQPVPVGWNKIRSPRQIQEIDRTCSNSTLAFPFWVTCLSTIISDWRIVRAFPQAKKGK